MTRLRDGIYTRRHALAVLGAALPAAYFAACLARRSQVPFLITADVHDQPDLDDHLCRLLDRLASLKLKITLFFPATLATSTGRVSVLRRIHADGHQVACHGLGHEETEDYYNDSVDAQRQNLSQAKRLFEDALGMPITAFRAPEFRISKHTLAILDELGFVTDLSVCSQRLPLLSSQIENYHWLFSPRAPYHPSETNPYKQGDLRLLEIPTSAAVLPLMSALNSVSVTATELLTRMLRSEATLSSKPLVYQCHPEDFILLERPGRPMKFAWRSVLPTRHGIPLRWIFEETDGRKIYRGNEEFLTFLMRTDTFLFLTVDEYVQQYFGPPPDNQQTAAAPAGSGLR